MRLKFRFCSLIKIAPRRWYIQLIRLLAYNFGFFTLSRSSYKRETIQAGMNRGKKTPPSPNFLSIFPITWIFGHELPQEMWYLKVCYSISALPLSYCPAYYRGGGDFFIKGKCSQVFAPGNAPLRLPVCLLRSGYRIVFPHIYSVLFLWWGRLDGLGLCSGMNCSTFQLFWKQTWLRCSNHTHIPNPFIFTCHTTYVFVSMARVDFRLTFLSVCLHSPTVRCHSPSFTGIRRWHFWRLNFHCLSSRWRSIATPDHVSSTSSCSHVGFSLPISSSPRPTSQHWILPSLQIWPTSLRHMMQIETLQ